MRPILYGAILGVLMILLMACDQAVGPAEVAPEPKPSVVLGSIEVLHVNLDKPVLARDGDGEPRSFKKSYMVRLGLKTSALPTAPAFNIWVGERRISELGGWQGGVYFHVYDPALLQRLAGGELFYQIGTEKQRSLDARLDIGDLKKVRTVRERDLFPNRRGDEG